MSTRITVATGGVCQHHGTEYTPKTSTLPINVDVKYNGINNNVTVCSKAIVLTEKCCLVAIGALNNLLTLGIGGYTIECPLGVDITTETDSIDLEDVFLEHVSGRIILDAGAHTFYLVNRSGATRAVSGGWLRLVASDCKG